MVGGYNIKPADRPAGRRRSRRRRRRRPEEDAADVRLLPRRQGKGRQGQRQRQGSDAEAGPTPSGSPAAPKCRRSITVTVFKVPGETNTDDLSPAPDAWSRPDIPLHALAMLKNTRPGIVQAEEEGKRGPMKFIEELKAKGHLGRLRRRRGRHRLVAQVATNSVLWFTGQDIPFVPNKRFGGVTWAARSPRSSTTRMEDSGALPIELDVSKMEMGDVVDCVPTKARRSKDGEVIAALPGQERRAVRRSARRRPHQPDHRPRR
jgi:hypothetical protein